MAITIRAVSTMMYALSTLIAMGNVNAPSGEGSLIQPITLIIDMNRLKVMYANIPTKAIVINFIRCHLFFV